MKYRYSLVVCWITCIALGPLQGNIDTLYICQAGDPVDLLADTTYEAYRWSPLVQLDDPSIAQPTARPTQTTLYIVEGISSSGDNLIENGNFSLGNTAFSSQYVYSPAANPTQGVYGIFTSGRDLSPQFFANCRDHTSGNGNLMVVDGSPIANQEVWCQTVAVQPNTAYAFSTWVSTVLPSNPAQLQFSINGVPLGTPFSPPVNTCVWRQFYETWTSMNDVQAEICVVNQNTNPNGNDFALDDFSFVELGDTYQDSFLVIVENIPPTVIDTAVCSGTGFLYNGMLLEAGTNHSFQFISRRGCDSLVDVRVDLLDTLFEYVRVDTLCPGEVFDFYGNTISTDTLLCELISIGQSCDTVACLTAVYLTESAIDVATTMPRCFGDTNGQIELSVGAGLAPFTFAWSDGAQTPSREGLASGNYQVMVMDAKSCEVQLDMVLEEPPPLTVSGQGDSQFCDGMIFGQVEAMATGGTPPWMYQIAGGQAQVDPLIQGLSPGRYELLVEDRNGCEEMVTVEVPPPFEPSLLIQGRAQAKLGERIRLTGLTNARGNLQYEWFPKDSLTCSDCQETEVLALETAHYTLRVTDDLGCQLTATFLLQVDRRVQVFIPNAFSPNGDGVNDTFVVYGGIGVERVEDFAIYDRWGNQLFYRSECPPNDPACGWKGESGKNDRMKAGVYVYTCTIRRVDGKQERYSGSVLLTN